MSKTTQEIQEDNYHSDIPTDRLLVDAVVAVVEAIDRLTDVLVEINASR